MQRLALILVTLGFLCFPSVGEQTRPEPFPFKDGDRVVLLGDTWVEREQQDSYIESRIISRLPGKKLIFRNLAWSADTVLGESRAGFDPPEKGFDRLKEQLQAIKPTVAFLGYGMAESFKGQAGLEQFKKDMNTLMDTIISISSPEPVRFIIATPLYHENLGEPLPNPDQHNAQLALYAKALTEIAAARKATLVDLFGSTQLYNQDPANPKLTENGIHPTPYGYWRLAFFVENSLGLAPGVWRVAFASDDTVRHGTQGVKVRTPQRTSSSFHFLAEDEFLVASPAPVTNPDLNRIPAPRLQVPSLPVGEFTLKIDGRPAAVFESSQWAKGQPILAGPLVNQAEELRKAVVKKNELFFHRWRPQNETYLFGFRKHEQGQNAKEIPMFDPLIAEMEARIFELASLKTRKYELVPTQSQDRQQLAPKPKVRPDPATAFKSTPLPHPTFDLAPGLEVTLFAENPDLAKPIHMNFDPQGRLWVASSEVYPQIQPGQKATDKILVLEDLDGDGKSDKTTIFADGLLIPTGVAPGDGGAYVANSTELLFYKDLDGDGHADEKRVLLSGFGTEDTHHILHSLRWGHDGQLYMNQSIYIHSHVETPHGVVRLDSGGIWNFRPTTRELGVHLKGLINSWGHHFDKYGQSFATDGAGHEGINWVVPQAMYVTYEGARRILGGVSPGNYPKFCGLEVVESEHFPEDWQGTMVTCDFRAHRVVRFGINDQDSGYITKQLPDVMRSTNVTFRPIDVKVGPDGALYVADWSNPIIQHGEVDFRDPRRDHEHGRIWRITYKGRKTLPRPQLTEASTEALLDNLHSANGHVRQNSRRILTERGKTIVPALATWTAQQTSEQGRLEALWMYQSLDVVNPTILQQVLAAQDGRIRAAGVRVLSFWAPRLDNPIDLLAPLVQDDHPRVRVEAVRALAKIPSGRSAELILSVLDRPMDRFLDYAVWLSINDVAKEWIEAVKTGAWKWEGREKQLEFALNALEPQFTSQVLDQVLERTQLAADGSGPWLELIAKAGSQKHLAMVLEKAVNGHFNDAGRVKALQLLGEAARLRKMTPGETSTRIETLFQHPHSESRAAAVRLVGPWRLEKLAPALLAMASASETPDPVRISAFQSLREIGGSEILNELANIAGGTATPSVRAEAVKALATLDLRKAAPIAIGILTSLSNEDQALNLWRALLANRGAAAVFAQELPKSGLPAPMVKAGLRAAREGGRNEPNLVLALARNSEEAEAKTLSPDELKQLLGFVTEKGDPARGELLYRRPEFGCVACHAIGGAGGKVGPDLTSLGASAPLDYIIEAVQFPNRKVKEGYHSVLVETKDEMEYSGILVRETDEQLILRDASNREVSIAKNNIQNRRIAGSIMPAGLIDSLNEQEQADLYRFMAQLGKPGPFDASKGTVARTWKLIPRTLDLAQFDDVKVLELHHPDWTEAFTYVDGRLPRAELEAQLKRRASRNPDAVYAVTRFESPRTGQVKIRLPQIANAAVWIDGKLVPGGAEIQAELASGPHVLAVKIPAAALPEFLRAESADVTFVNN